jgi:hypothetical protein
MSDSHLTFEAGFKGIQQFKRLWKEAEESDSPGPRLSELFSSPNSPLAEKNLHILLKATFTRYCNFYCHEKLQAVLDDDAMRASVETHCASCLPALIKNVASSGKSRINAENPKRCNATLLLLLSEPVFRTALTEFDFQSALQVPIISEEVVRSMIAVAEAGSFDITAATHAMFQDLREEQPDNAKLHAIGALLDAAYERRVQTLLKSGSFENTNVILDRTNCERAFPTPFHYSSYGSGVYPYTSVELVFNSISSEIRLKENWTEKCCNPDIVQKWREEMATQIPDLRLFDLVIEQLQLLRQIGHDQQYEISPVENVFQSDSLVSLDLKEAFKHFANSLEQCTPPDYHPGSEHLVVDLVHPSLYPAVAGRTRVRKCPASTLEESWKNDLGGLGLPPLTFKENKAKEYGWSKEYSWIPAEFHVHDDGEVAINSYINNLHPKTNPELYDLIGDIFSSALPMIEQVLSTCVINSKKVTKMRLITDPAKLTIHDEFDFRSLQNDDLIDEYYDTRVPNDIPLPDHFPGENLSHFVTPKVSLRDKRLQIIVKMARIELTPDNPVYTGGSWHVEGMRNEDIVCSVIHYYSCENITESRLQFRQAICEPIYEQHDERGTQAWYNLSDEAPLNQELGSIRAREGRTVAFPNTLQHCVQPFELADKSLPGHRKILVYFLVNPLKRILSTAHIPPQMRQWAAFDPESCLHQVLNLFGVPDDVVAYLYEFLDFPMSRADAEEVRESLMHERSFFVDELSAETFERPFSLCEH